MPMRARFPAVVPLGLLLAASCAGQAPPSQAPSAEPDLQVDAGPAVQAPSDPPAKAEPAFPERCAEGNAPGVCAPPAEFVEEVCSGRGKPDAALVLFEKEAPWTRGYVKRNVEAWYTGSRSSKSAFKSHEEVIVLRHTSPTGGIIVNGGGAPFDVIRLDGACATLGADELTLKRPGAPWHPAVPWRLLDPRVKQALSADEPVARASSAYDDGCREASSAACARAGAKLTQAIVGFLARGGKVPALVTWR
jgi:hypothetical protein